MVSYTALGNQNRGDILFFVRGGNMLLTLYYCLFLFLLSDAETLDSHHQGSFMILRGPKNLV